MPGPAARMGDMTAHGGSIVVGFPTVLIGGQPAARLGDMHVCPLVTPGLPPIPHVGGPVLSPGSPTVLIGGAPAATLGCMCTCVGPPDMIAVGCPTVLIGSASGSGGSGGSGGGGGGAAANASAATALFDNNESITKEEHWLEIEFVDKAGLPVSGIHYKLTDPDNVESEGVIRLDGTIRRDALASEGQGKVILMSLTEAKWSKEEADVGEKVKMQAKAEGFEDGTKALFQIFKRDISGPDVVVVEIETTVSGEIVKGEWDYKGPEGRDVYVPPEGSEESQDSGDGFSSPDFYFTVVVESCLANSGLLRQQDFIEIEVIDEDGNALANEPYIFFASNGEVRKGQLDGSGKAREEGMPPGYANLKLPGLPDIEIST